MKLITDYNRSKVAPKIRKIGTFSIFLIHYINASHLHEFHNNVLCNNHKTSNYFLDRTKKQDSKKNIIKELRSKLYIFSLLKSQSIENLGKSFGVLCVAYNKIKLIKM